MLCDRALLTAFVRETRHVDGARRSPQRKGTGGGPTGCPQQRRKGHSVAWAPGTGRPGRLCGCWDWSPAPGCCPGYVQGRRPGPSRPRCRGWERLWHPMREPLRKNLRLPSACRNADGIRKRACRGDRRTGPRVRSDLLRTLWKAKVEAEAALPTSGEPHSADWSGLLRSAAGQLDVMSFQPPSGAAASHFTPCFLEVLPHASAKHAELWVLARRAS